MTTQMIYAASPKSARTMAQAFVSTGSKIVATRPQGVIVQHADGSILVIKCH